MLFHSTLLNPVVSFSGVFHIINHHKHNENLANVFFDDLPRLLMNHSNTQKSPAKILPISNFEKNNNNHWLTLGMGKGSRGVSSSSSDSISMSPLDKGVE